MPRRHHVQRQKQQNIGTSAITNTIFGQICRQPSTPQLLTAASNHQSQLSEIAVVFVVAIRNCMRQTETN